MRYSELSNDPLSDDLLVGAGLPPLAFVGAVGALLPALGLGDESPVALLGTGVGVLTGAASSGVGVLDGVLAACASLVAAGVEGALEDDVPVVAVATLDVGRGRGTIALATVPVGDSPLSRAGTAAREAVAITLACTPSLLAESRPIAKKQPNTNSAATITTRHCPSIVADGPPMWMSSQR
jgi:hypothetical protein